MSNLKQSPGKKGRKYKEKEAYFLFFLIITACLQKILTV